MAFCEQCGARITDGAQFCEECGCRVEEDVVSKSSDATERASVLTLFEEADWKARWENLATGATGADLGIIMTRESALLQQIAVSPKTLHELIRNYTRSAAKRGVNYHYLDLDKCALHGGAGDSAAVVKTLREVVEVARPKYLLILGNEDVIDVVRWKNEASDGDEVVESDLCYSTLDVNTPWNGQAYDWDSVIRVGRLPTYQGEPFEKFASYFHSASASIGNINRIVPYGLSALVWEDESNDEFSHVSSRRVDVSPNVTKQNVKSRIGYESNLFLFNLHGSDATRYWYGQEGALYPEAFEPSILEGMARPYYIGVEACYGARYLGGLGPEESIVLKALQNQCVALLGSSRIAFGTCKPKGSCADIVVGRYVAGLKDGLTAGDAHVEGLRELCEDSDEMDDSDIKTLAEFALYGDPSAYMSENRTASGTKRAGLSRGLSVPIPDVSRAVHLALADVDKKIEAMIDECARRELMPELSVDEFEKSRQTTYQVRPGLKQKVYCTSMGGIRRVAKVYFDDDGNVRQMLVSR